MLGRIVRWELRQHLRDPLTLLLMVGMPLVLYPAAGLVAHEVQTRSAAKSATEEVTVAVDGAPLPFPDSVTVFSTPDPRAAVVDGRADAGVRHDAAGAEIWTDSRHKRSSAAVPRVKNTLDAVRPVRVEVEDLVPPEVRRVDQVARLVPAMLVVTLLVGGLYTALDLVTGEKERGTLETLLTTSVERRLVFAAKFLVVLLFTLVSAGLSLAAGQVSLRLFTDVVIPWSTAGLGFLLFLPIGVLLAVLLTLGAAWAPDFKTGQILSVPMLLVPSLAAAAALFPGVQLTWAWALVPLSNLSIALRQVLLGDVPLGPMLLTVAASVAYTVVAVVYGARFLGREDVLLGTRGSAQRRMVGDYRADAAAVFALGFLLLWFLGQSAQTWSLVPGMFLTQLGLLAPLAVGAVTWVGLPLRETLSLRAPRPRDLVLAALVGVCLPGVGFGVNALQEPFLPVPEGFFEGLMPEDVPLPLTLVSFALLPGLCEELLFRGALLGLLRRRPGVWAPILSVAVAFGAFHLSIFRFFPTAALGVLLGLLVVRGRSLWCGVVAHTINNGLLLTAAYTLPELRPGLWVGPLAVTAVGLCFLVGRGGAAPTGR